MICLKRSPIVHEISHLCLSDSRRGTRCQGSGSNGHGIGLRGVGVGDKGKGQGDAPRESTATGPGGAILDQIRIYGDITEIGDNIIPDMISTVAEIGTIAAKPLGAFFFFIAISRRRLIVSSR